jgi:hypothetical protein
MDSREETRCTWCWLCGAGSARDVERGSDGRSSGHGSALEFRVWLSELEVNIDER